MWVDQLLAGAGALLTSTTTQPAAPAANPLLTFIHDNPEVLARAVVEQRANPATESSVSRQTRTREGQLGERQTDYIYI